MKPTATMRKRRICCPECGEPVGSCKPIKTQRIGFKQVKVATADTTGPKETRRQAEQREEEALYSRLRAKGYNV